MFSRLKTIIRLRYVVPIFFLLYLILGLLIYQHYGLSWDEPVQHYVGQLTFDYVAYGKTDFLLNGESLYGPIFELGLIVGEKLLQLNTTREIFLFRHLVTFLAFFSGTIGFYFLGRRFLQRPSTAFLAVVALVLSPRIFEHSFYNTKDIPALVFFVFSFLTLFFYLDKPSLWRLALHGIVTAIVITIRITGLLVPVMTCYFLLLELFNKENSRWQNLKYLGARLVVYLLVTGLFTYLCWPVLWTDTLLHLRQALWSLSRFQWLATVRFMGQNIQSTQLPWFYLPVWILFTTPFLYSALFFSGTAWMSVDLLAAWTRLDETIKRKRLAVLGWFFGPICAVIFLKSVVYDSWRHVFFTYPAFLLIAFWGWERLQDVISQKFSKKPLAYGLTALTAFSFLWVGGQMALLHPYEQLYFNRLAGENLSVAQTRFEMDYWGLSYRAGLQYILSHDSRAAIKVATETDAGKLNAFIFSPGDQKRLVFVDNVAEADYYLHNYRWDLQPSYSNEVYSVVVMGTKILSVFRVN